MSFQPGAIILLQATVVSGGAGVGEEIYSLIARF